MSQLSPLSQPIEINTNTHNATQQIRSIMSSINSNEDSKTKSETDQANVVSTLTTTSTQQQNITKSIVRSISTPITTLSQSGNELRMTHLTPQNTSVPSSPNIQTSQSSNILFVKQIRTPSTQNAVVPSNNSTIVVMSQSGQLQSQGSVIISKPSNLLSILSNQQVTNVQQSAKASDVKMDPPSTMSIDTSGLAKSVTILKTNPTITNLLNINSFKRSKSTDDASTSKESQEIAAAKRLSLESSHEIKTEPIDLPIVKEIPYSSLQKPENTTTTISLQKPSITPSKPEDSQNVLLKQLLQNSGSSVSSPLARTVPGIITNQRAPSLGVFSSLEAQLARPVIPPAPAKPIIMSSQPLVNQIPITNMQVSTSTESMPKNSNNTKIVSRETSFVSLPTSISTTSQVPTTSASINIQSLMDNKPVVVLNRNDVPSNLLMQSNNSMPHTVSLFIIINFNHSISFLLGKKFTAAHIF
jgi:[histone H3]-lysine4 N-trimethyltransferase MLL3